MNSSLSENLALELENTILYDDETGDLNSPDIRTENLEVVLKRLISIGEVFDNIDDLGMNDRTILSATFIQVVDTYLQIVEKHEQLLDQGK